MHSILRKSIVLVVICSFVILCGFPGALAEYSYVDLAYLANHLPDYVWMTVNTTGTARRDTFKPPEQIGQVFLEALGSPYVGVWLHISSGLVPSNGSLINVSAIVVYDPMWLCYYLEAEYWGPAIEWNPADINFDLKVDIFDCVTIANAYGSKPGNTNWNPFADINNDGIIDIFDALVVAANFGKEWLP